MKRTLIVSVVFAFVLVLATPAFAADLHKPLDKAYHGVEKIVKSPMHLVNDPIDEYKAATFKPFGLIGGLLKGIGYTVVESVYGVMEIVTSPFTLLEK
jgi:hypothetical protein